MAGARSQTSVEIREGTSHWRQARELPKGGRIGAGSRVREALTNACCMEDHCQAMSRPHDYSDHCQAALRTTGKEVWFQPQNNLRSGGVHSALSPPTLAGGNASHSLGVG